MGVCFYYQALIVYFGDDCMNVDNEIIIFGEGIDMEYYWDEVFGYYGVFINFFFNKDNIVFWGVYFDCCDFIFNCNQQMMDVFIKGWVGISNDDFIVCDEVIVEICQIWEIIIGVIVISYLNMVI